MGLSESPCSLQVALQAAMLAPLLLKLSPGGAAFFLAQEVCSVWAEEEEAVLHPHCGQGSIYSLLSFGPSLYIFCLGEVIFQKMGAI